MHSQMSSLLEKLLRVGAQEAMVHFLTESIAYFCRIFRAMRPLHFFLLPTSPTTFLSTTTDTWYLCSYWLERLSNSSLVKEPAISHLVCVMKAHPS